MQNKNIDIENLIKTDSILFFDLDGTLVDTNYANFLSYKKAIYSVTKVDYDLVYNSKIRFNRTILKNTIPNLNESQFDKIIIEKESSYNDFLHEIKLNHTVSDILIKYSRTNKTVLVTNCRKDRAITTLNYFNLYENFGNIFYRQFNVIEQKINKYGNAISKLNIMPSLIIAFEDEETEIKDALDAGIININKIRI